MDIAVCVKPVPDPNIVSLDARNCLNEDDLVPILNPHDLAAVEEAIRLKEKNKAEGVTVLSIAPPSAERFLRRCLAMGADRVVRLWDAPFNTPYTDAAGIALAQVIGRLSLDLILCGQKASDYEMGFCGYVIAAQLGAPFIQRVVEIEIPQDGKLRVTSKREGGNREIIEVGPPAVLGIEAGLNEPRYASLPNFIASLRQKVEQYDLKAFGLSEKGVESKTRLEGFSPPRPRPKKIFVPDSHLPAAERMRLVMSGGITEKKGGLCEGNPEELSQKFIEFLNQVDLGTPLELNTQMEKGEI